MIWSLSQLTVAVSLLLVAKAFHSTGAGLRPATHLMSGAVSLNPNPEDLIIFCNREMHSKSLEAIGFDMDFTLAQYNEAFDLLAFEGAQGHLHSTLGYPKEVLDFKYNAVLFRRGLLIDKKRGNIVKVDNHR